MSSEIWFIQNDNDEPLRAFMTKHEAEHELENLVSEEERHFSLYSIEVDDIDDYPEEMAVATEEGLV
ncbi:hypothetical protein [Spirochaeta cellobiosiphila]|uniref:hypothetical protein n=1 Tax=Spirochaeta cellobiosiphila TaxID=504483 RepID=UPI00040BDD0F|nr:hypothetical protein [Spirochaeta cellobiosiphila]